MAARTLSSAPGGTGRESVGTDAAAADELGTATPVYDTCPDPDAAAADELGTATLFWAVQRPGLLCDETVDESSSADWSVALTPFPSAFAIFWR